MKSPAARRFWFVLISALILCGPGLSAAKPWALDSLMELKTVGDPQISPDGSKVAFVVHSVNSSRNAYDSEIWIIDVAGATPSKLINPHFTDSSPRWSGNGKGVAFLSRRAGSTQIYVVDQVDGEPRTLTDCPTDVTYFKWSPNHRWIGYLASDGLSSEELKRRQAGDDPIIADQNYQFSRLYIVPVKGGKAELVTLADRHVTSFDWAPDGNKIVCAGQATPRNRDTFNVDLYEIDLKTKRETPLVVQPGRDANPSYSKDGALVAFHTQAGSQNYFEARHIGIVHSGGGHVRYVTENFEGDVFRGGDEFWWSPDDSELIFGAGAGTRDYVFSINLKDGTSQRLLANLHGPSSFSVTPDGSHAAFVKSSNSRPPEIYIAELGGMGVQERQLSDVTPEVSDFPAIPTRTLRWKSKDGLDVEGVLRLPSGSKAGERVPLLVELHGGPTGVALEGFPVPRTYPIQLLLQEGFAVFSPNFRGSSNYGAKFRLANIKSQGFGDLDDIMTGIDMLVEQGIADPERLGVMGWSYGGFLGAWIIGHTGRFKAASIGAPGADWISWYGASDGPREVMWTYFGGKPWDTWETYNRHSPRYSLVNAKTPSLLLHGEKDIDSAPEIYQALTDVGTPVEFVTYPREGHGFVEPMHQRDLMSRNLMWFQRWLLKK
jgi:dipeptidyl aminopeptidase/acylaminoacyl peptidase